MSTLQFIRGFAHVIMKNSDAQFPKPVFSGPVNAVTSWTANGRVHVTAGFLFQPELPFPTVFSKVKVRVVYDNSFTILK
jgi:hypothetical protein